MQLGKVLAGDFTALFKAKAGNPDYAGEGANPAQWALLKAAGLA